MQIPKRFFAHIEILASKNQNLWLYRKDYFRVWRQRHQSKQYFMVYFKSHPTASELTTQFMEKKTQDWVTNGRSRKQNEREVRNSTQCSDSMESIEEKESVLCVCSCLFRARTNKDVSSLYECAYVCVVAVFSLSLPHV